MLEEEKELDDMNIPSAEKFSLEVEGRFIAEGENASYIDITTAYLEELDIEPSDAASLISKSLYDKIKVEATNRHMLKERNTTVSLFQ